MTTLTLYATDHCSLCDIALDMLLSMDEVRGMQLEVVDIALNDALLERFALSIPVLALGDNALHSPFSREDVVEWLNESLEAE